MVAKKTSSKKGSVKQEPLPAEQNQLTNLFEQTSIVEEAKIKYEPVKYFIQLHISNLYDCISSALIVPSSYINDRTNDDIQSKYPKCLVISKGFIDSFDSSQCLVEISLKKDEIVKEKDIFLIYKPLPISRIKKIVVSDNDVKEKIIKTTLSQDVGYIPDSFITFIDEKIKKIEFTEIKCDEIIDLKKESEIFDRLLGLFAFMKNQQFYYFHKTNILSNYSEHFLEAFSLINSEIEKSFETQLKPDFIKAFQKLFDYNNSDISQPNSFIINHIYNGGLIDNDFINKFFDTFQDSISNKKEQIIDFKNQLLSPIGKKQVLPYLLQINDKFYKVAYLYIYGKKGSNDKENLKNLIQDELVYSQSEICLALLGLYYGYKQIRPYENITFNNSKLINVFGDKFNLKFKLDQKLDYILIESLYEYIFNNHKANKEILAYEPNINSNSSMPKQIKNDNDFEIEFEKNVFGSIYFRIKVLSEFDKIHKHLVSYPEIVPGHFHIISYVRKYYDKTHYLIRDTNGIIFKSELLKLFEDNKIKIGNFEHFYSCIELDKKFNLK